jgi:hypothetical protein
LSFSSVGASRETLSRTPRPPVARVAWDGEIPWTAAELLQAQRDAADDGAGRRSVVDDARAWLREALAAAPRPAGELRQDAAAHSIVGKTLYAARKAEGVTVAKERVPNGRWFWTLTPDAGDHGEDCALPHP